MAEVSKQDIQYLLDAQRNTLLQRLGTKQDMQIISDVSRDKIMALLQQQAQLIRQMNYQNIQMYRRVVTLETRMANMEYSLKTVHQLTHNVAENMPRQMVMPAIPETNNAPTPNYSYNPAS